MKLVKTSVVSSRIHGYSYSLIACQAAYLATYFPSIYWNTAYLRVVSGLDMDSGTNYSKVANGVGSVISKGINVSLIDINKSKYMFEPDEENNTILYSLKALDHVGGEVVDQIISNRPYSSFEDFRNKNSFNKTVMVSLIKSGAFDQFDERKNIMEQYIWEVCEPKKRITMQNFNALNEKGLLPDELSLQSRTFVWSKMLKKNCKNGKDFTVEKNYYDFYEQYFDIDLLEPREGKLVLSAANLKKQYDKMMEPAKEYLTEHKEELLEKLNNSLYNEMWDKYAAGSYSDWEMDSLAFYYHEHPLKNIDYDLYNIRVYNEQPEEPVKDYVFKKAGKNIPIFKTYRICGTVIAKDDAHSSISLLTPEKDVVTVKFTRDYYARYNKTISQLQLDGTKKVMEKGWFTKGTQVVVNGFRRGNTFVAKKYKKSKSHQLYKITQISGKEINIVNKRYGEE